MRLANIRIDSKEVTKQHGPSVHHKFIFNDRKQHSHPHMELSHYILSQARAGVHLHTLCVCVIFEANESSQ